MKNQILGKRVHIMFGIIIMIIIGALAGGVWSLLDFASAQRIIKSFDSPAKISVKKQDKTPLLISSPYLTSLDGYKPNYGFSITNVSDKPIRAYTIQTDVIYGNNSVQLSGSILSHLTSERLILQSNQSKQEAEGGDATYPEVVKEIILSVDFVEFIDGTTWGNDHYQSAENLAGQRAGGKAAIKYFQEKLEAGELDLTKIETFARDILKQSKSNASSSWKRGFETGIGIVRNRITDAQNNSLFEGVKKELEKPFDALEGRKN